MFWARPGMGGAGDVERGVDAGTGVLGGIGVLVGSAIVLERLAPGANAEAVVDRRLQGGLRSSLCGG
jgi:hypothetical protein